jgi:hypothetical protein
MHRPPSPYATPSIVASARLPVGFPMPGRAFLRPFRVALPLVLAFHGCAFDPPPKPILPEPIPLNDTPHNTLRRFDLVYEQKKLQDYEVLFASNFRFTFSSQSDPDLADTYGTSWGKDDEIESTQHLFEGFTDSNGDFQAQAGTIELAFEGFSIVDDPYRPDSGAYYKFVIVPSVQLRLAILGGNEVIVHAPHDLYLVRGDVAVLDDAQEARDDRWYVWRWDDRSPPVAGARSWGAMRSTYAGPDPAPRE